MFNIIAIVIILFLSSVTYFIYSKYIQSNNSKKLMKLIKGKYFSNESLCSGFLNDVLYDTNSDSCQIPCFVYNTFKVISSQKFISCGKLSHSIKINGGIIKAKINVSIMQHTVVNKRHYENKQSLKV